MKKIVTVFALALICSGAYAQFNKGRYLVGGSLGFNTITSKVKNGNTTATTGHASAFSLGPDVGYFVIDKLAVGGALDLSLSGSKGEGTNNYKSNTTTFTLTPFVRYYLDQGIFFQGQVGFGSQSEKYKAPQSNTTTTTKNGVFDWALAAGYAYFLNDFVAIEPTVGYGSRSVKNKDADTKAITGGLFINVGFQVYLGPRN